MTIKKTVNSIAVAALFIGTAMAGGGGATGGSTEVTQLLNNAQLLDINVNSAQQALTQISQYETELQHTMVALQNIKKLGAYVQNFPDIKSVSGLKNSVQVLLGDLKSAQNATQTIVKDISLRGLSPDQYVAKVTGDRASAISQNAQNMVGELQNSLQAADNAYASVQNYEAQIPLISGHMESLQMLNSQMNTMIVQNARMMQNFGAFLGNEATKTTAKSEDEQSAAQASDALRKSNAAAMQQLLSTQQSQQVQ